MTHKVGIKELEATESNCCVASCRLRLGQNVALGNNSLYQLVVVVCIQHAEKAEKPQMGVRLVPMVHTAKTSQKQMLTDGLMADRWFGVSQPSCCWNTSDIMNYF